MLKALQKFLTIVLLLIGVAYLLYQGFMYNFARERMPQGMMIAGLDVSGLSEDEVVVLLNTHYMEPLAVFHGQEQVEISPQEVGFVLDLETMLYQAELYKEQQEFWQGFLEFLLGRSLDPVQIELGATHDRAALIERLETIASFLDQPIKAPQLSGPAATFQPGEPGYVTNIKDSLTEAENALYHPDDREVHLVVEDQNAPAFDVNLLADNINRQLETFDGIGSVFILDLQTGEELGINADVAMSGLSILKIAIFVEAYRVLDSPPNDYVQGLFYDTAVRSSNYGANLLLHEIAGANNTYRGADILTESMRRLGLVNTFMAIPYDAVIVSTRPSTYTTPANSRPNLLTVPDTAMQTTAEEIGTLLSMIYYCAQGGGALLAVYPGQITPDECQAILDLMVLNEEGNLIRFGVPEDVPVSHKHGWDFTTHGDAGIVFSPGGDFVIVEYVTDPMTDWLPYEIGFPILREIARATYNYFNFDNPNLEDPADRADREAAAREAAAEPEPTVTPGP